MSAKGTTWDNHKYLYKKDNRYIYKQNIYRVTYNGKTGNWPENKTRSKFAEKSKSKKNDRSIDYSERNVAEEPIYTVLPYIRESDITWYHILPYFGEKKIDDIDVGSFDPVIVGKGEAFVGKYSDNVIRWEDR